MNKLSQPLWASAVFQVLVLAWSAAGNASDVIKMLLMLVALNVSSFCLLRWAPRERRLLRALGYALLLLGPWGCMLMLMLGF